MKEVILIKLGEIVLKGLNKHTFESQLIKDLKYRIKPYGNFNIKSAQSTITVESMDDSSYIDDIIPIIRKTFGIVKFSRAFITDKNIDDINKAVSECLGSTLNLAKTFKVESKRSDKKFYLTSPEIAREVGYYILQKFPNLTVDVHSPDVTVTVEIRDFGAYVRAGDEKGIGGLPCGTGGKAAVMISGGIDSPVASFMMAKRGLKLVAIHFASPPYTSERAERKVIELLEKVCEYSGFIKLYIVPFTEIQERIKKSCPEELFTLIMRRMMMRISENIATHQGCEALITGESLGQVASQTLSAIYCTDNVVKVPVFRPLIGMDKDEIIRIAKKIETFDISIQPFEDCCTVFVPKHPRTRPRLENIEAAENNEDWDNLINDSIKNVKIVNIN